MHDGMPYGRNQGQGHSREVDRQSPTGLIFLNVILSSCHHSLCMYVCYVYFNIIKINQSIKIHPTKIAGIVLVIVLISGFNSMHLRVVLRRKKV